LILGRKFTVFGAPVNLGMALLATEALGLGHRQPVDAGAGQRIADIVELEWLDYGDGAVGVDALDAAGDATVDATVDGVDDVHVPEGVLGSVDVVVDAPRTVEFGPDLPMPSVFAATAWSMATLFACAEATAAFSQDRCHGAITLEAPGLVVNAVFAIGLPGEFLADGP
jgi:hypothetical protein